MPLTPHHRRRLSRHRRTLAEREADIRAAREDGGSLREIAEAVGLSKTRVAEIVNAVTDDEESA